MADRLQRVHGHGRDPSLMDLMACPFLDHTTHCNLVGEAIRLEISIVVLNDSQDLECDRQEAGQSVIQSKGCIKRSQQFTKYAKDVTA